MGRDWREGRGQRAVGACSGALLRARGEGEAEDERRGEAAEDLLEQQPDAVLVQADKLVVDGSRVPLAPPPRRGETGRCGEGVGEMSDVVGSCGDVRQDARLRC